ncbi:FxSxx-COOH system tetratricopeptide repeat protein [Nonomuraea sp. B5E05]|uniref:FxSxx-COOH system tetratricopeptide repeat protein n=1 Tax=Nonomuraea sp. B5E05 TaxID=3153569 RepID=UPI0032613F41
MLRCCYHRSVTGSRAVARGLPEVWGEKIPPRNKNFTGRDGLLEQLRAGIAADVTAVVPHALHGMGGVGKTQVAVEYAWRYQAEYDLVWWISADQALLVPAALAALAPRLNLPPAKAVGIDDTAAAVLHALRRGDPYDRWLLIFDNADRPEDINQLIPRGPGHVLITSRNQEWRSVVETVPVDVFTHGESVQFLHKRVSSTLREVDARRLADELGHLPLALEQAGALQAEAGMSVDEYLQQLAKHMSDTLQMPKPLDYPRSMTAAWRLSVSQLEQQLTEAVELMRCCAFFGPEPIPVDVFRWGVDEHLAPGLQQLLDNPLLRSKAIRLIGRYALAKLDPETRTLQVHRLIQALLRADLSEDEQDRYREIVHVLLASPALGDPDDEANWPRYAELVQHIVPSDVAGTRDPRVREFALNMVRYLYASGQHQTSRAFVESFLQQWTKGSGPDDPHVIDAQAQLGKVLRVLGDYPKAFEIDRAALERARRVFGPQHEKSLFLSQGFGGDLRAMGDFVEARDHDEQVLQGHETFYATDHIELLHAKNNLALDYALVSHYQRARAVHENVFTISSRKSDVSKVSHLLFWGNLARVVRLCGDYEDACDLGEDAYAFGVQELDVEHWVTLRTGKDLSIALRRAGRYDEAIELAQDVYERYARLLGPDHPDTLAAAMNHANTLRTTGQINEAFERALDTMNRYPQVYGEEHPYNRGCAGNLALLHRVRGDAESARRLNEQCLAALDSRLSRDHHYALVIAINLASDLTALGELDAAQSLSEDTMNRSRKLLGAIHPLTLGCSANLSVVLRRTGAEEKAEELLSRTVKQFTEVRGSQHPDTVVAGEGRQLDFDFDPPPI